MKNREKYKNELIKAIKKEGKLCEFIKNHGVYRMLGKERESFCEMNCVTCVMALQLWLLEEYEEPEVDWNNIAVDTPILVRQGEDGEWIRRHFAKYKNGIVYTWKDSRTSWTVSFDEDVTGWNYAKLAESE